MPNELAIRTARELQQGQHITITVVVLDKSGSMQEFGDAPPKMVNEIMNGLKGDDQSNHYFGLVTFNDRMQTEIEIQPVDQTPNFDSYEPKNKTLLYKTVYTTLAHLINLVKSLHRDLRTNLKVVVAVISDGDDNKSDRNKYPAKLQKASKLALDLDFTLLAYGIGISGKRLAQIMGFEPANAMDLAGRSESFHDATVSIMEHTIIPGDWGQAPSEPGHDISNP